MAKKKTTKRPTLTDQLRQHLDECGLSRYRIAQETGIDQSALSRFLSGERGISAKALDTLGALLDLEIIMHGPWAADSHEKGT